MMLWMKYLYLLRISTYMSICVSKCFYIVHVVTKPKSTKNSALDMSLNAGLLGQLQLYVHNMRYELQCALKNLKSEWMLFHTKLRILQPYIKRGGIKLVLEHWMGFVTCIEFKTSNTNWQSNIKDLTQRARA